MICEEWIVFSTTGAEKLDGHGQKNEIGPLSYLHHIKNQCQNGLKI